jgi:hypothetical protein
MASSLRLLLVLFYIPALAFSQVGIGTSTPHTSAQLDVSSTTKGFLPPRMNSAERSAISASGAAAGLVIYNTTLNQLEYYNGTSWKALALENASAKEPVIVTATTTNPVKPSTTSCDQTWWVQVGYKTYRVYMSLCWENNTGSSSGSGVYLFSLPTGLTFSNSYLYTSDVSTNANGATIGMLVKGIPTTGYYMDWAGNTSTNLFVVPYSTDKYRLVYNWGVAEKTQIGNPYGGFNNSKGGINISFDIALF